MRREIKFRGRSSKDNKTWFTGSLVSLTDIDEAYIDHYDGLRRVIERYPVNPATVGQFTGLRDADGVDIYEGDVLQKRDELAWRTVDRGCVFWSSSKCRWCVEMRDGLKFTLTSSKSDSWRVVGNVHDSPGLLEDSNGRL